MDTVVDSLYAAFVNDIRRYKRLFINRIVLTCPEPFGRFGHVAAAFAAMDVAMSDRDKSDSEKLKPASEQDAQYVCDELTKRFGSKVIYRIIEIGECKISAVTIPIFEYEFVLETTMPRRELLQIIKKHNS